MTKKFLSGSTLKWIALITMFIDHIGAVLIPEFYSNGIGGLYFDWVQIYRISRDVGRISFPIFCFLLIEGYLHTKNKWKYLSRMFTFALISEVFFDYAVYGSIFYLQSQNIFFELTLGILLMIATDFIESKSCNFYMKNLMTVAIWCLGMLAGEKLGFDYGMYGILSIGILYLFRSVRELQILAGAISFCWELPAPIGIVISYFYNGKRGSQNKYFFYAFYPLHLALFGLIKYLI